MIRYLPLALWALVLPAWADLYKWTDDKGNVHYSDKPPEGGVKSSESMKLPKAVSAAPPQAPATKAKTAAELDMDFRKRQVQAAEAQAKAQKDAEASEDRKRNCTRANAQVAQLERGGRIARPGPNGEQVYMSDEEIAKELVNARKVADSWCKQ